MKHNDLEKTILDIINQNKTVSAQALADKLNCSYANAQFKLVELYEKKILFRKRFGRIFHYELNNEDIVTEKGNEYKELLKEELKKISETIDIKIQELDQLNEKKNKLLHILSVMEQ